MANELNFYGDLSQTGLTVEARVYNSSGTQVGSNVSCSEVGTLAIYVGDMPTATIGQYGVRFFDSNSTLLSQGVINWDGDSEIILNLDIAVSTISSGSTDLTPVLNAISALNDISTSDIRTELTTELARLDVNVSSVAYNDTAITNLINALPTLVEMEASAALTAIADITGLSTHDAADVVTAMQVVADDFKANLSAIETKAQADTRQVALISEHDTTQAAIGAISFDDTAILAAISALNNLSLAQIEGSSVLAKEVTLTAISSAIAAIPTTDNVADLTPVLTAISNLNDVTPAEVRAAFNEADFKDKNLETEIHAWLDSYTNKNDWKGTGATVDLSPVQNVVDAILIDTNAIKPDLTIINDGVKKSSLIIPHSEDLT